MSKKPVIVTLLLAFCAVIAIPNFFGAQGKSRTAAIKGNMRAVQIMMESYATDSGGSFPSNQNDLIQAFKKYCPHCQIEGTRIFFDEPIEVIFVNPGHQSLGQWLKNDFAKDKNKSNLLFVSCDGNSYACALTDRTGKPVPGVGGEPLVLSNQ